MQQAMIQNEYICITNKEFALAKKRGPGGGRKPKGEFAALASPLSIRMSKEMRTELEAAANKRGRSISQEVLRRLTDSFYKDRTKDRDRTVRALCYLISDMASKMNYIPGIDKHSSSEWRTNPFIFKAFKTAVASLLDFLEPPGKIISPLTEETSKRLLKFGEKNAGPNSELAKKYYTLVSGFYESPEDLGRARFIETLTTMATPIYPFPSALKAGNIYSEKVKEIEDEYYGHANAWRDLNLSQEDIIRATNKLGTKSQQTRKPTET
jgi:hypothetical protein